MHVKFMREDVIDGLAKSSLVVAQKNIPDYLKTLWFKVEDKQLQIIGTDGNVEFVGEYLPLEILEEGLIGVNAKKIYDLLKKFNSGEITLKADTEKKLLHISQEKRKYKMHIIDSNYFPETEIFPKENKFIFSSETLKEILEKMIFCLNENDMSVNLTSMNMQASNNKESVECCTFSGQNMAVFNLYDDNFLSLLADKNILLHKKYLVNLKKWLGKEDVEIGITDGRFFVRTLNVNEMLSFPLMTGEYFNYQEIVSLISNNKNNTLSIKKDDFIDTLGRISLFSTSFNKATELIFTNDNVRVESISTEEGEANENLECQFVGNLEKAAFNIDNLQDILANFKSDDITIILKDATSPVLITGENDLNYFVITMPVQIKEESYYPVD